MMKIDNYNIDRDSMFGAEWGLFHTVRNEDRIYTLFGLHHKMRDDLKRTPTLEEYLEAYLNEWKIFLKERGVKSHQYGREKDFDLNDFYKLKPFIEERAFKAYRSVHVEDQVEQHLRNIYKGSMLIVTHKLIDMVMGVDIIIQKANSQGKEVYLYIHVMDAFTEKQAIAKKKDKQISYKDEAGRWHKYSRDFRSLSHCYFCYDGKSTTGMIPVKEEDVKNFIERELKRSETEEFDTPFQKGTMRTISDFKQAVTKSELEGAKKTA